MLKHQVPSPRTRSPWPMVGGKTVSVSHDTKTPAPARSGWHGADAGRRLQSHGRNRLAGGKKESGFQAFLRQYQDFMRRASRRWPR
jgi:magnesium-transporting ATPase (P-type)